MYWFLPDRSPHGNRAVVTKVIWKSLVLLWTSIQVLSVAALTDSMGDSGWPQPCVRPRRLSVPIPSGNVMGRVNRSRKRRPCSKEEGWTTLESLEKRCLVPWKVGSRRVSAVHPGNRAERMACPSPESWCLPVSWKAVFVLLPGKPHGVSTPREDKSKVCG